MDLNLLTPKQAAKAIGVSESSIRRWCDQGRLNGERTAGGHRRIRLGSLVDFARQNGMQVTPASALSARTRGGRQADESTLAVRIYEGLIRGDDLAVRGMIADLVGEGRSLATICDRLLAPALSRIGHEWSEGRIDVYEEHRATQVVLELLTSTRDLTKVPDEAAPIAICAALSKDIYSVATAMAALVLREVGWRSINLGPNTPAASICQAIAEVKPSLVALSVSYVVDAREVVEDYRAVQARAVQHGVAVAVGGRALVPLIRREMTADFFGDTMAHLASFATRLR